MIALGTRLSDFTTASKSAYQNPSVRFIGINVVPMDANKLAALPVVADAKRALGALSQALRESGYRGTSQEYRSQVKSLKAEWDAKVTDIRSVKNDTPGKLAETAVIGLVNESFGGKATVVCAAGGLRASYSGSGGLRIRKLITSNTDILAWVMRSQVAWG